MTDTRADTVGLDLVARVTTALLEVRAESPTAGLESLLEVLVDALRASSGSLYRIDQATLQAERLAQFGSYEAPASSYHLSAVPEVAARLLEGEPAVFATSQLGEDAPERHVIEALGIRHGMVLPMLEPGGLWGILAFWWGPVETPPEGPVDALMAISALVAQTMRWLDAEQERRRITAWFRLYAEASSEAICIHETGRFVDANEPALRLLGVERDALLGRSILDFAHPSDHASIVERLRSGTEDRIEVRVMRADGVAVWCELHARQAVVDGAVVRMVVARDVSEAVRARTLHERMLQAQRLDGLGLLASGIAHDFNNLLVGVLGNAELVELHQGLSDPTRRAIRQIREAATRARQLLDYAGKGPRDVREIDVVSRVQGLLPLLHVTQRSGVRLQLALQDGVPPVAIDGSQLDQVVMNLVTNAVQAVDEGVIRVSVSTREVVDGQPLDPKAVQLPPGRYVVLEVADDGMGMDAATRDRVFDPFFSTRSEGRGLGLAAVHGIVRRNGGWIEVESEPGAGATFRVFLPALDETVSVGTVEAIPTGRAYGRVLVVDDDEAVRSVVCRLLESSGFVVHDCANGRDAIEWLREPHEVDAVVLDLTMPGMSGEQVFERVRALRPDLPVLLCSGALGRDGLAGASRVARLSKPFTRAAIVDALVALIGR
ncbi:MAG: ATP-binding protein [Myxococcota bacterium]